MKIVYNYIAVPTEGSKIHIDSFLKAYRGLGESLVENGLLIAPYEGGKEYWSRARKLKIRLAWFRDNLRHFYRALKLARKNGADVVLYRFDPMHHFALSILGVSFFLPVVLEINALRSIEYHEGRPRVSDWLDWLALRRARKCFVVSKRLKEHLVDHYGTDQDKVQVIENGADVEAFDPSLPGAPIRKALGIDHRFVIGFVGSFRPWHGVDHLIAVAERLKAHLPEAIFLMIGTGGERERYEQLVQAKGLSDSFHFAGQVPHAEIPDFIAAMDVTIALHAATRKGFHGSALKLFEYMAMAKPVIAVPVGQIREVIDDGKSGFLVEARDTEKIVAVILRLQRHAELRERIGRRARERVIARYTWQINAARVKSLCLEACHG